MDIKTIINRSKNLIISPVSEWEVIKSENQDKSKTVKDFLLPYVIIIGIATLLGSSVFHSRFGFSLSFVITSAIISVLITFAGVYVSALLINEIAQGFGSVKNIHKSFEYVTYSFTAYFIATAASDLIDVSPVNILLQLAGLYSFYILWTGAEPMMGTPEDKKAGFVVVSGLLIIGVFAILGILLGLVFSGVMVASAY